MPAGIALRVRLSNELLANARRDLALAPRLLMDRSAALGDALMMHAKDLAHNDSLSAAVARGDRAFVVRLLQTQHDVMPNGIPVLVGRDGTTWSGPAPTTSLVEATKAGKMPVDVATQAGNVRFFSLAGIEKDGVWLGAAGFAMPMNEDAARVLAGLTRSDVVILAGSPLHAMTTTLDSTRASEVARAVAASADLRGTPHEIGTGSGRLLVTWAPLGTSAAVAFVRVVADELAVVPSLTHLAVTLATVSLVGALLLGVWLTTQVTKPVRQLSDAAHAFAAGTNDVPLPASRFDDIAVVSRAFSDMRDTLAARLADLERANQSLSDHATRLSALQNDLMQRQRLDAVNRMVVQLAHEVRNPIASLRNLLELIRRRATDDESTARYAEIAIDELLRMHELAERMLDINRPPANASASCDAHRVASDVARLSVLGAPPPPEVVVDDGVPGTMADIGSDALRQVLLNLVQNAREAIRGANTPDGRIAIGVRRDNGRVTITVRDNGPGIPAELLTRVFDPFVTTKQQVHGVGLGLYVAESTVRTVGGTISAQNEPAGGASFVIVLPAAGNRQA